MDTDGHRSSVIVFYAEINGSSPWSRAISQRRQGSRQKFLYCQRDSTCCGTDPTWERVATRCRAAMISHWCLQPLFQRGHIRERIDHALAHMNGVWIVRTGRMMLQPARFQYRAHSQHSARSCAWQHQQRKPWFDRPEHELHATWFAAAFGAVLATLPCCTR